MNSIDNKQQLTDAIELKRPQRLPYTISYTKEMNAMMCEFLGLENGTDLADYFGCNTFSSLWSAIGGSPKLPERTAKFAADDPNVTVDIWGVKRELTQAGDAWYWEITDAPLASCETITDIENYDWPTIDDVVFPEVPDTLDLAEWKKDKVVLDSSFICPFGVPWAMRGMEEFMMDLYLNPGIVEAIVAKVEEYTLGCLEQLFKRYPGMVDLIGCGDDYGSQNGLLIGPDSVETFFMPSLKRHYDLGKKHGAKGYHHSCGAIFEIIPAMIEAGLNVLNPIQTSAVGMDPAKIKEAFGKDLCFHGGVDTQDVLVNLSEQAVRDEVRMLMDTLGPDGYILAPSHVLQVDVKPENIVAMYEEVRKEA